MQLIADYERRIEEIKEEYGEDGQHASPRLASERAIRLAAVEAERAELQNLLNKRRINEQVLFVIQRELDIRNPCCSHGWGRGEQMTSEDACRATCVVSRAS